MPSALRESIPLLGLLVLLAVAYLHPRGRIEAATGVLAAAAALATGALDALAVREELRHLVPVVAFLAAILVVGELCRAEGLFTAIGQRFARTSNPRRLLLAVFAVAAVTTTALSLDATVVLLTPVVLGAASTRGMRSRPLALVCVRLANSGSLLLPVSNLTNLLAFPALQLTVGRFALLMAPVWLSVLAIEYAVLRWWFRRDLTEPSRGEPGPLLSLPRTPLVVVTAMLVAFAATSPFGIDPAWVAVTAAVVLAVRALEQRRSTPRAVLDSAHLPFALFVLCLGLVVATLGRGEFGAALADLLPHRADLPGLLLLALIGAVLANVVNNLPATLLLVPLLAPLGTTALLATLIGVNIGSSLTWTGSLANLLWRRTLEAHAEPVPSRDFHLVAVVASPMAIAAGVCVLYGWSRLLT